MAAKPVLNTGIVVRLNSGGPLLTIVGNQGELVLCNWFSGDELRINVFPPQAITVVEES
jgi:uncharacterized protein YodC (DUF2158 family)